MKKSLSFLVFACIVAACGGGGGGHGGGGLLLPPGGGNAPTPTPAPTQTPAIQSGSIYVGGVHSGQDTVATFDANGNPKSVSGTFPGLQSLPTVKYDSGNGLLYTLNSASNGVFSVDAFNPQGQKQTLSGSWSGLTNPGKDIAYDPHNGLIYVPNFSNGAWTMLAFDGNGNLQSQSAAAWKGLKDPHAIAFDSHNNQFYISNPSGVQIFDEAGTPVTPAGAFENLPTAGSFVTVQSILYDPHNQTLYVAESNSTILTYDENGSVKSQSVWQGVFLPGRMAFNPDNNRIYITELTGPFAVTIYDESGNQKTLANTWNGITQVSSIAVVP